MTCFPIRQQNKTSRAGAVIGTRNVHTAQSTAVIPEATFIDICQKKHLLWHNNITNQCQGIRLVKLTVFKKYLFFPFILQKYVALNKW